MHGHGPFRSLLSAGVFTAAMLPLAVLAFSTDPAGGGDPAPPADPAPDPAPAPPPAPSPTPTPAPPADPPTPDHEAEAEKWKALARKHESRSTSAVKALTSVARQLGVDPKDLAQSDADAAIETVRSEARAEALREVAHERVESAFTAATAGRMTDAQRDVLLEGINAAAFLTDDGKVDRAKIVKHVEALAPVKNGRPDLGQGRRERTGSASSVANGRELYRERHAKKGAAAS